MGELKFEVQVDSTSPDHEDPEADPEQQHTLDALAAFGLKPDRPPVRKAGMYALWPENAFLLRMFLSLQTQWQVGPNGPTGLKWDELRRCAKDNARRARRLDVAESRYELEWLLKSMEQAALAGWAVRAERQAESAKRKSPRAQP